MRLGDFTTARVDLGRAGVSLPTKELLELQLAHARARDAVHARLDAAMLARELGRDCAIVHSAARDRHEYLRRPDLGRRLSADSRTLLTGKTEIAFVIVDGLSALAVQRHAVPLLDAIQLTDERIVIAEQGRVAIGDEIAQMLGATMAVVLIGERPGLSSPNSLGVYLTWQPRSSTTDAERNCISNIRSAGLSYAAAAHKLRFLMTEARQRKLSGVRLKESAAALEHEDRNLERKLNP